MSDDGLQSRTIYTNIAVSLDVPNHPGPEQVRVWIRSIVDATTNTNKGTAAQSNAAIQRQTLVHLNTPPSNGSTSTLKTDGFVMQLIL